MGHSSTKDKIWDISDMDADHITAWSAGGSTNIDNCQMEWVKYHITHFY